MDKVFVNKLQYAFFSPIVWLKMWLNGIEGYGKCFWNGIPYFSRKGGSSISVGNGSRFASRSTSNIIGINRPCMLSTIAKDATITIGRGCSFSGTTITSSVSVSIGDNVRCGANTTIMDTDGHSDDYRTGKNSPIVIDDEVWIGAGVTVMKGSFIGRGALIGAGSVIRNVIPPYSVVLGNPAKVVGFSLTPDEIIEKEKKHFEESERLPLELLQKNYDKYFINRIKEIKQFTKL
jgi:acetyltransferase-like isoleucine patch superfamily enzyme